jgi:uncharacterized damage-inducible protein DinB
MPTQTERRALIAKIRSLPREAQAAVKGLSEEQLRTPYRDGGWTVAQVIHHLADSHMNAYIRMRLAMTEEHPTIKPYDQDSWANLPDAGATQLSPSLAILRGLHRRWTAFLKAIPAKSWDRTALHPERGDMTLDDLLALYAEHGEKHVGQILGLRRRMGW